MTDQLRLGAPCSRCGGSGIEPRTQAPLSDIDENTPGGFRRDGAFTSRLAAFQVMPRTGTQRRRVFEAIAARADGLSANDVSVLTGIPYVSTSARMAELSHGGWIEYAGVTRETEHRAAAKVFVATARGQAVRAA